MNWNNVKDFAKSALTLPALSVWVDFVRSAEVATTVNNTVWAINWVLSAWNSYLNPIFNAVWFSASSVLAWVTTPMLTEKIFNDLGLLQNSKKLRWAINLLAWAGALTASPAYLPWIIGASAAYTLWKPAYNLTKNVLDKTSWALWWVTGWAMLWAFNWLKNWVKKWFSKKPDIS